MELPGTMALTKFTSHMREENKIHKKSTMRQTFYSYFYLLLTTILGVIFTHYSHSELRHTKIKWLAQGHHLISGRFRIQARVVCSKVSKLIFCYEMLPWSKRNSGLVNCDTHGCHQKMGSHSEIQACQHIVNEPLTWPRPSRCYSNIAVTGHCPQRV